MLRKLKEVIRLALAGGMKRALHQYGTGRDISLRAVVLPISWNIFLHFCLQNKTRTSASRALRSSRSTVAHAKWIILRDMALIWLRRCTLIRQKGEVQRWVKPPANWINDARRVSSFSRATGSRFLVPQIGYIHTFVAKQSHSTGGLALISFLNHLHQLYG